MARWMEYATGKCLFCFKKLDPNLAVYNGFVTANKCRIAAAFCDITCYKAFEEKNPLDDDGRFRDWHPRDGIMPLDLWGDAPLEKEE